jgi:hypothetical protein
VGVKAKVACFAFQKETKQTTLRDYAAEEANGDSIGT